MSPQRTLLVLVLLVHGEAPAWRLEAVYTADYLRNTSGGIREGAAYLQNVDLTFESRIRSIFGPDEATIFAHVLYNDGTTFSDAIVGDAQVISNIDTGRALRVYELWYEQTFGKIGAKFGLFDLNSEFDAVETAGLFLNSSHGIGAEYGQSGENGPSIFPVTSLALRIGWRFSSLGALRYVILDGVPGDPDDFDRTTIDLGGGDGVLHNAEVEFNPRNGLRLGAGYWRYSADFEYIDRIDSFGEPLSGDGNDGWYVFAEGELSGADGGAALSGFLRYGRADDAFNDFKSYLGAGLVVDAPFGQADSQLGFAIASAETGDPLARVTPGIRARETTLEFTYRFPVTSWLHLQPDLQFVMNPGVDPSLNDAWVVGMRIEIGKSLEPGQ